MPLRWKVMVLCDQVCPVVLVVGKDGQIPDTVILISPTHLTSFISGHPCLSQGSCTFGLCQTQKELALPREIF